MFKKFVAVSSLLLLQTATPLYANDLGIKVILASEVRPGVYGQVQFGNTPPSRVVYTRPIRVIADRRYYRARPVYLNVPPAHSMHWARHCEAYRACGRKVYFVRTREYDADYQRYEKERKYNDRQLRKKHKSERNDKHKHSGNDRRG